MNVGERKEKAENRTRSASRLSLVKKQRLFKMTDIERNMLVKALDDVSRETRPEESAEILSLMEKALRTPDRRLYLSDREFHWAAFSLNGLRSAYLSVGRSSGGIDKVLCKLMSCKYRRAPAR